MKPIVVALSILSLCALASAAHADCTYPKPPESMPEASSATKEVMIAAMAAFKQYSADVDAYVACLDQETNDKVKEAGGVGAIMQIKALQAKKKTSASDERQAKIEEFNKQVRAFKAKG
jgi:hypothetical protein